MKKAVKMEKKFVFFLFFLWPLFLREKKVSKDKKNN